MKRATRSIISKSPSTPWGDRILPDDFDLSFQKIDRRCDHQECMPRAAWIDLEKKCVAYGRWSVTSPVTSPTVAAQHLWEAGSHLGWAIVTWCIAQTHGRTQLQRFAHDLLASVYGDEFHFDYGQRTRFPVRKEWSSVSRDYHHMARDFMPYDAAYPEEHYDTIRYLDDGRIPPEAIWEIFTKDMRWVRDFVAKRFAVAAICQCRGDDIIFRLQNWCKISYDEIINLPSPMMKITDATAVDKP